MKRWCLCLSFLMLVFPSFISSEDMTAADVAASVNGRTVGMASYLREYSNLKERYRAQYGEYPGAEDEPHIQKVVLDNLIAQELLLEECEKAGITADRAYVNEEMDYYRNQFPDDQSFTEALSKEGISREELSERIAHSRQIETLISERIAKGISVTESEGREYYAKHPE
ncbi:MAG TPA: SurA N-terminal domain-containing protein, partial [Spirochaetia bacterium]|nr:SurA N-terminal domain-containing protein [Spirochaetia bacterium]